MGETGWRSCPRQLPFTLTEDHTRSRGHMEGLWGRLYEESGLMLVVMSTGTKLHRRLDSL